jgi:guanine deaminase
MKTLMNSTADGWMREAIRLARLHMLARDGGPFGAVVVRREEIIARGWNRVTSANDPTAHAEVVAIRRACRKLKTFQLRDCILVSSCEPCPMCLSAAYWARVNRVIYGATRQDAARAGFDDDVIYREISRPLSRRRLPLRQLLGAEAAGIFAEWLALAEKTPY